MLALLMVMLLLVGCLAACGGNAGQDDAGNSSALPDNSLSDTPSDGDAAGEGDESDVGTTATTTGINVVGKTTKGNTTSRTTGTTKANTSTKIPTSLDGQTIVISTWATTSMPEKDGTEKGNAAYYAFEWAKKAYNVNVEWKLVPEATYFTEFTTAALSGGSYSDISLVHSQVYLSWIMDDLLVPLTSYMKNKSDKYWNKSTFVLNNELYAMKLASSNGVTVPENYFLFNTKMLEQLNLENPQKLALAGEWTWDKFREYCRAATDPSAGTYGVSAFNLNQLMFTNSIEAIVVENGKYLNGYTHGKSADNMLELLTFLQQMKVQDGSIMGNVLGGQEAMNDAFNAFLDGKVLFTYGQSEAWLKKQNYTDYSPVTFPIGPNGDENSLDNVLTGFSCWGIPTNARYDYADLVNFFCDSQTTWEKSRGDAYFVSDLETSIDTHYYKYWARRSDAEFMFKMGAGIDNRIGWNVYVNNGQIEVYKIFEPVLMNKSTPKSVLDSTDGQIQTNINSVFGG